MKKCIKKLLSIVLSVSLIISLLPTVAFAGTDSQKQKKYLFMGDSMSYNFVNDRHDYTTELAKDGHYPAQVAKRFGYECVNELGSSIFTLGGVRATDIYAALSDSFDGDGYTKVQYDISLLNGSKDDAIKCINDADVISIQLGHSSISTYGLAEILYSIGAVNISGVDSFEGYGHDLGDILTKNEIKRVKPLVQTCIQNMALSIDEMRALEKFISDTVGPVYRKALVKVLGVKTVNSIETILPIATNLTDTITYILISDMIHFDGMMKSVLENKKSAAKIYVLGLFNPVKEFNVAYTIGGKTITINLGDILDVIFNIINEYYRVYSEYSCYYYYVSPANNVETYGDLLAKGDEKAIEVATELMTALKNDGSLSGATDNQKSEAKQLAPLLIKLAEIDTINLNEILDDIDDLDSISLDLSYLESKIEIKNGELIANEIDKLIGKAFAFTMLQGVYVHPSQAGHDALAKNLIKTMEHPKINSDALNYHITEKYIRFKIEDYIKDFYDSFFHSTDINRLNSNPEPLKLAPIEESIEDEALEEEFTGLLTKSVSIAPLNQVEENIEEDKPENVEPPEEVKKPVESAAPLMTSGAAIEKPEAAAVSDDIISEESNKDSEETLDNEEANNDEIIQDIKTAVVESSSKISKTKNGKKGIKISWNLTNDYGVDYYQVWRSTSRTSGFEKIYTTKTGDIKSYVNTKGLTKGKKYYYKVRGIKIVDGEKYYTDWSKKAIRTFK